MREPTSAGISTRVGFLRGEESYSLSRCVFVRADTGRMEGARVCGLGRLLREIRRALCFRTEACLGIAK